MLRRGKCCNSRRFVSSLQNIDCSFNFNAFKPFSDTLDIMDWKSMRSPFIKQALVSASSNTIACKQVYVTIVNIMIELWWLRDIDRMCNFINKSFSLYFLDILVGNPEGLIIKSLDCITNFEGIKHHLDYSKINMVIEHEILQVRLDESDDMRSFSKLLEIKMERGWGEPLVT